MWVFRDQPQTADFGAVLEQCRARWRALAARRIPEHEAAVELLLRVGELESALVDTLAGDCDTCSPLTESLRRISLSSAHLFRAAWRGRESDPRLVCESNVEMAFESAARAPVPKRVSLRVPEGYAYYSLFPEMYLEAAAEFARRVRRAPVLCLGLRSIGTSLSAVVAAELEAAGWPVRSDTLRPRGHPWDRAVRMDSRLRQSWSPWLRGHCLIVDEGPGLSGSSFVGTAREMERLGFARKKIGLFPSWEPQAEQLCGETARQNWSSYRKTHVCFENIWLDAERLYPGPLRDLSAGAWREIHYTGGAASPAVHPYHERRKYLGPEPGGPFLKFVGLGRYGAPSYRRAEMLGELRCSPAIRAWRHGFLYMERVSGVPLRPVARPATGLLKSIGDYLGILHGHFRTGGAAPVDRHLELAHANLGPSIGARRSAHLERFRRLVADAPAIQVDSRMLPHEWLRTDGGYVKCDGTDHHDDHFYPGEDDIAWDVAGTRVEFGLGTEATCALTERVGRAVRDPFLYRRLPFYTIAYLAYRIGYASMAVQSLGDSPDGRRFGRLLALYRRGERIAWAELEAACRRKRWC